MIPQPACNHTSDALHSPSKCIAAFTRRAALTPSVARISQCRIAAIYTTHQPLPASIVRPTRSALDSNLRHQMADRSVSSAAGGPDSAANDGTAPDFEQVLFIEAGSGADQHGQNATKAAVRACRNAIEFNSLPAIRKLVPNGYDGLKLGVKIGVPDPDTVDVEAVKAVFPYGSVFVAVVEGGLRARSGIAIAELGDKNDDWYIAVAAVTVGY